MTTASFDVPIINDSVSEDNENFDLILTNNSNLPDGVILDIDNKATVTIVDDDGK